MSDEKKRFYKRSTDKGDRVSRFGSGSIGVAFAVCFAFVLEHKGVTLRPGVEAAMGAILGAFFACLHDVFRYVGQYIKHRLGFNPPSEEE